MNFDEATEIISELAILKYFPSDPSARIGLVKLIGEMADNIEQVRWLVARMLKIYNEWPGPVEMRACFCSKFRPRDGVNAYSQVYLDGIPSEKASGGFLASAPMKAIAGDVAAPKIQQAVKQAAERMPKMPAARPGNGQFEKRLAETLTAPQDRPEAPAPTPQIITQSDIDRAVAELRQRKAEAVAE